MIENGQFALIHYTGTLANGEIFDTTEGREPFEFEIGGGFVIPAFEDAIKAMAVNDEKEIFIKSADAYGNHNPEMTQTVPLEDVKQHLTPEKGMVIQVMLSNGQHTPARITDVTAESVILDFNHPLAGEDLNFKLKLVGINDEATMKEECGCGDDCGCEGEGEGCGSEKGGCGCGCN
jgi:FKBP-type peptidyl-prolyl cis-trans isomerase 2